MSTPNYDVNYDDKRFTQVETEKNAAISDMEKTYGDMIDKTDSHYQGLINENKAWEETQKKNQQAQTDFAIEQIEQKKEQAQQDYLKEQSGAYADWQKQSNQYGVNAEQMAAQGMQNTGFSESSQVSMFNQYQQRVATARETISRAKLEYDNQMNEARLQNSTILAEIAHNALQQRLELALQQFQHKNELIKEKLNKKTELENQYYTRWQDVLKQINTENAMKEEVRQYNETLAENKRQHNESLALQQAQLAEQKRQFDVLHPQGSSGGSGGSGGSSGGSSGGGGGSIKKGSSSGGSSTHSSSSGKVHGGSGGSFGESKSVSATSYLNELVRSGANEDKVANEISIALRKGAISKKEAADLRKAFTPRGVRYN